ncbi:efflux transporter outer membrane subunit [Herminiimonas arsenitoxidans]|uniref:efflux transporter outer membrane subunit n=1 Tax=Herminiimonas arsenitoxidans TaxID=1809410 RepID=UPI000971271B|nr:efflux transporter outer membrane subunit [Herminiimonas arsenitoxidans]
MLVSGCAQVDMPKLPNLLPSHWTQTPAVSAPNKNIPPVDLTGWWKRFGDAELDALVERALSSNMSLLQAKLRLQAARALAGNVSKSYLPRLDFSSYGTEDASAVDSYYQLSLGAVWKLGLFGAQEGAERQAGASVERAAAAEQEARVALVAEVVRNYLELRAAQQQIATAEELVTLDKRTLELTEVRITNRLAGPEQRLQLQARLARTQAALSQPKQAEARALYALAALVGQTQPDSNWSQPHPLPALQTVAITQVPSDLLRSRPDMRIAEAEVLQAVGELGIAKSALYPRIAIGASYLYSYNVTQNRRVTESGVPTIGPLIDLPLFDWGQRQTIAAARKHEVDASLAGYRQVLLDSVAQVETGIALLTQAQQRVQYLRDALAATQTMADKDRSLTRLGLSSEWNGLEYKQNVLQAKQSLTAAETDYGIAYATLFRALGGAPMPPADNEPQS